MSLYGQLLALGLVTGSVYALSALGLILTYRVCAVVNIAHAATGTLGGYLMWWLADSLGWPTGPALVGTLLTTSAVGALTYLLVIRPLRHSCALNRLAGTIAVHVVLLQVVLLVFGTELKVPEPFLPTGNLSWRGYVVGRDQVCMLALAGLLTLGLGAIYRWTRFGLATSAVAESPQRLEALGWSPARIQAVNWTVAGGITGLAGVLLAPVLQLSPGYFTGILVPTLAGAVLGGFSSFPLALAGSLVVGVLQAESTRLLPLPGVSDAIPFLVIIILLVAQGTKLPARGEMTARLPRVRPAGKQLRPVGWAVVGLALILLLGPGSVLMNGITLTLAIGMILLSQVLLTGYAGQFSLVQFPVAGTGAVAAGFMLSQYHWPFPLLLAGGALTGMVAGTATGLPSLRVRGINLAMATLGSGVAINTLVLANPILCGGLTGTSVPSISIFGLDLTPLIHPERYAFLVGAVLLITSALVAVLRNGRKGRTFIAIRNNERAAASLGINPAGTKLLAFALAGAIAGMGGVLLSFRNPIMTYTEFDAFSSVTSSIQTMIGGIGFPLGATLGALGTRNGLISAVADIWFFEATSVLPIVVGVIAVLQLVLQPDGIAGVISSRRRRRPAPTTRPPADPGPTPSHPDARRGGGHLEVDAVTVRYGAVTALDNVALTVEPGEVLAVIGPNGSGKTTLMDAVSGYCGRVGEIRLDGERLSHRSPHQRARSGLVRSFQSLELFDDLSVLENLRCAADQRRHHEPERSSIGMSVDLLGLDGVLQARPGDLDYGTRRLVAIARALCAAPRLLMLDEPAAGLSDRQRREFGDLIQVLADQKGISVLLVEHDVDLVARVADRVLALDSGRMLATGPPADVLTDPDVITSFLGTGHPVAAGRP